MKLVQHPNVVRLYEVIDTTTRLFLVMELGTGGDMYDRLVNKYHGKGIEEELAQVYFRQVGDVGVVRGIALRGIEM